MNGDLCGAPDFHFPSSLGADSAKTRAVGLLVGVRGRQIPAEGVANWGGIHCALQAYSGCSVSVSVSAKTVGVWEVKG